MNRYEVKLYSNTFGATLILFYFAYPRKLFDDFFIVFSIVPLL